MASHQLPVQTPHGFAGHRRCRSRRADVALLLLAMLGFVARTDASQSMANQVQVNTVITSGQGEAAVASTADGGFVVVWESWASAGTDNSARSIQARRYAADGTPQGAQFQVNSLTSGEQKQPAVAMSSAGFVVVWESNDATTGPVDFNIRAQRYGPSGAKLGGELLVNSVTASDQSQPAVAMVANGDFVVVWWTRDGVGDNDDSMIQGRRWSSSTGGFYNQFLVNDVTAGAQSEPAIATDGVETYLVAWRTDGATTLDIAARRFTHLNGISDGVMSLGFEAIANTYPYGPQTGPSVAMTPQGAGIVVWESWGSFGSDDERYSIQARRLDSSGFFIDPNDIQINTYKSSDQRYATVSMAPNGIFSVAWQSYGSPPGPQSDSSEYSIQLRSFSGSGAALDLVDVQANSYTIGDQRFPAVALDPAGRLVVAWESNGSPGNDNSGFSLQARRFDVFLFADGFEAGDTSAW